MQLLAMILKVLVHTSIVGVRNIAMIRTYKNQKTVLNKRSLQGKRNHLSKSQLSLRDSLENGKVEDCPDAHATLGRCRSGSFFPAGLQFEAMMLFPFF